MSWEKVKLNEVCEIIAGQSPPSTTYNTQEEGLPFYQGKADFGDIFPRVRMWCSEPNKIAEAKDTLLSVRAPVGPTNICDTKSCIGRGLAAIRSIGNTDYKYVFYYFKCIEPVLSTKGSGSTFSAITIGEVKSLEIPLPPLETQQQIAAILDKADALRKKDQQLLSQYDQLLQSIFYDMFGDPVKNEKGWEERKISHIAKNEKHAIKAGPFGSSLKKEFYVKSGYKIYGQEQVIRDDLSFGDYYIDEKKYRQLVSCKIETGDILISLVGTYGKISIVPDVFEPGIINPRLMKISPDKNLINSIFFKKLLISKSIRSRIESVSRGGTMDIVNVGIMKEILIPVPPITLQNQFASIAQNINHQKQQVKQQMVQSENLFQSLLQRAFKGELVV